MITDASSRQLLPLGKSSSFTCQRRGFSIRPIEHERRRRLHYYNRIYLLRLRQTRRHDLVHL